VVVTAEPEQQPAAVAARVCDACAAPMAEGQDWCLECGTAAPGRLGGRPGMRAAATVVALTLALVGGAVAASYAALSTDAQEEASRPAPPSGAPVAQAPNVVPSPAETVPPVTAPATPPVATPTVPSGGSGSITPTPSPTPSPSPPSSSPGPSFTPSPSTGSGTPTPSPSTPAPTKTTPSKPAAPQPIDLDTDAASVYDPSSRAIAKDEPKAAVDSDDKTAWTVTTSGAKDMAVGLVVDLGRARGVKILQLATSTPGFRAEIFASDSDQLPPDILDTRWAHIRDRSDVDETAGTDKNVKGDGKERIVLGGGSAKYRYVLVWLTTPPDKGPTVKISDLQLLG